MRVLHIIASADLKDGGPIEGVIGLRSEMARFDVDVELLTLDPPGANWPELPGATIHACGRPLPAGYGSVARLRRWARISPEAVAWARAHARDYDVIVVNGLWNYANRVARLALRGSGVPYVVFPHGMLDPWFRRRYPLKHVAKQLLWLVNEGPLVRDADAVLFTCEQEQMLARKTFWPYHARERVVAYGAAEPPPFAPDEIANFRKMVPALEQRRYLLFLGRIHEKKGCDLLIEAFARIAPREPDLDLVIAGPDNTGCRPALVRRAEQLQIIDRIHWPGMITGTAKLGALRGAEAFVLPSHQENFGIAVAEALSCRCPVLISDQVNIWREIEQARAGICASDTLEGTMSLLEQWLDLDEPAREAMREHAEQLYKRQFTVRAAAESLHRVFRDITNN